MASSQRPHSDSDGFDSNETPDQTYELTTPSQDGFAPRPSATNPARPRPDEGGIVDPGSATMDSADDVSGDASEDLGPPVDPQPAPGERRPAETRTYELEVPSQAAAGDSSQTLPSDAFDEPIAADSQTFVSDEFDEPVAADSQTLISDEFDDAPDSQTIASDEFDGGPDSRTIASDPLEAADDSSPDQSRTFVSDEFDPSSDDDADGRTIQSHPLSSSASAEDRTIQSDYLDQDDRPDATLGNVPDEQRTFVSEDLDGPRWADTGAATMMSDVDRTDEDSQTLMSDSFADDDPGLMAQSNVRQTITPKSMDSADRKHWDDVIRGALGSQAVPARRKKRESSLVGLGSNLNIQTRTLIEGVPGVGSAVDYRIEKKLGEGGMGAVYLANQTSLNRNVALKVIKPISDKESQRLKQSGRLQTVRHHREGQFLSEAVVTGDLEHPNIVPIYDVAATQDGTVFYAMKCVVGTPWSKVIRKKSLQENLDILLKVCDAIAFAHSRGVVHRDLKPENVMLGEFGVVLVMDWGLALTTPGFTKEASIKKASSLGGSPAYMAPELATGPLDRIGPAADIYLIGAMLYEVITGRPPHSGSNVSQCLRAAATNKIDATKEAGELLDIALRAMATRPEDRYPTVQAFQEAVRGYLAHAESIGLAHKAKEDLSRALSSQRYADYARAMFGFEQAIDLWDGNEPARQGLSQAQRAYAEHALSKADYELGLSLLDESDPSHLPIVNRLRAAQREQEQRKSRLAVMKRIAVGLVGVIFVGGSAALAVINEQKNQAVTLRHAAEEARDLAVRSERAAEEARDIALAAKEQEVIAKNQAIALKEQAEQLAIAEKAAKEQAVIAQKRAEEAAVAEMRAREEAVAQRLKAEQAALAEKKAKEDALLAKEAETKAKEEAVAQRKKAEEAAVAEKLAKEEAIAQRKKAEEAALAEMKAKELETKAKEEAVAQRKKAEAAALAETKAKELEQKAKEQAILAQKEEEKARMLAEAAQKAEEKAKLEALAAKEAETRAKDLAIAAEKQAQYEAYIAKIGLAKARIDQNEFDGAVQLLQQLKQDPATAQLCGWEWNRLMHQASQATSDVPADEPARDVSFSGSGRSAVAVVDGGRVRWLNVAPTGTVAPDDTRQLLLGSPARTAALSPDERTIATGEADGLIRLWDAATGRERARLQGHTHEVSKVRFLSNDRLLSASADKTVRLWDVPAGRELANAWHIAPVEDVAFSAGRTPVVAAAVADSRSGRVALWQVEEAGGRTALKPVGDFLSHPAPVYAVALTADGRRVASGDGSGRVLVWEREGLAPLDYGAAIDAALERIAPPAAGRVSKSPRLATGQVAFVSLGDDDDVTGTYRLATESPVLAHADAVRALSFSHSGDRLVSAADDFSVKVWDVAGHRLVENLRGHGGWVRSATFSPLDDDLLLTAGFDKRVKSWRISRYEDALVVDARPMTSVAVANPGPPAASPDVQAHADEIWSARFSRQGTQVVTTSRDRSAKVWTVRSQGGRMMMSEPVILTDTSSPQRPRTLVEGHRYLALSIQATSDGQSLLIGSVDGSIRIFQIARGTELGQITGCGLNSAFALSADGRLLLTSASAADASALLWEFGPRNEIPAAPRLRLAGHQAPVTAFAISADGQRLYTGDQKGIGYLWDAATGEKLSAALNYHGGLRINAAAFLPDGRLLTASDDLSVTLVQPETGAVIQRFTQPGFVTSLSLAPDGRRLLTVAERSGGERGATVTTLLMADLVSGATQTVMTSTSDGPKMSIRSARFAPDGLRVVSLHGGYDAPESLLRLWQVEPSRPPQLVRTLKFPERLPPADAALLVQNQKYELVTLHGNAGYQWSLTDLEHHQSFRSHAAVTDAAFSADGRYVATCSESVKIWDAATGKPLYHLDAPHDGPVYGVDFTPLEGRYLLATAGGDGRIRTWEWLPAAGTATPVQTFEIAAADRKPLRDVRYSPDGQRLLAVGDGGQAALWEPGRDQPLTVCVDPAAAGVDHICCAFADDGATVVIGSADKRARLFRLDPERFADGPTAPLAVLEGHADRIESVAFLPAEVAANGFPLPLRVLTGSRDRSARVWDAATGREVMSLRKHSLGLTAVDAARPRLSADETRASVVLTAGLDGRLILWPAGP